MAILDEMFGAPAAPKRKRMGGLALFLEALLNLLRQEDEEPDEDGVLPPESEAMRGPEIRVKTQYTPRP